MAKKKIPTRVEGPLSISLEDAFGGIPMPDLPEGTPLPEEPAPAETPKGSVVLRREKAHRNGKTVIVVDQFTPLPTGKELKELARVLQTRCGCGGSLKGESIEIQGDQPVRLREILQAIGYRVRGV